MSQTYAADEEDASPLTSGYPAGKIALAIVLAAALHGVLLGSSLLIGPSKKPAETTAKGATLPVVGTNPNGNGNGNGNGKTGTDTAASTATTDKKADEPKSSAAPKGDAGEDLKLDEK